MTATLDIISRSLDLHDASGVLVCSFVRDR